MTKEIKETPVEETPTTEQIAQNYSAALDSVNLIAELKGKKEKSEADLDSIKRNQEHLELMIGKTYWKKEDLNPLKNAIK